MALYCPPSHTLRGLFFFPLFWFSPVFCRNQCQGMCVCRGGWGGGGNKWNIKTPVSLTLSTCPRGADGQKAPSAVHLSPVTRTAKPSSHRAHRGWHAKRCAGKLGSLAGCCCCAGRKHGACQTTASLSGGSARLDRPDVFRHRGMHRSTAKSWEAIQRQW